MFSVDGRSIREGEWITIDGTRGHVHAGQAALIPPELSDNFLRLMTWADRLRHLVVRVNADTPADAHRGREFGAEGIGLCRTEHMFFEGTRLQAMREMIVAQDSAGRQEALKKLLPMQRSDFEGIFRAMEGYPVTIRLLDPPLHEFLPHEPEEIARLAQELGKSVEEMNRIVDGLSEVNPMLGLRGCRLAIIYPEIPAMQVRAIFEAACTVASRKGQVLPEIMVPLTASVAELRQQARIVRDTAEAVFRERDITVPYLFGTMIELPRAALTADSIALEADFFSFGTNDLTQTTWGLSRDDAGRFLPYYLDHHLIEADPFQVLDQEGVGRLVRMGVELGRKARPDLKIGICGEHGGEPASVGFCDQLGLNYVSCSPFRVPIARLAAAQAALADTRYLWVPPPRRGACAAGRRRGSDQRRPRVQSNLGVSAGLDRVMEEGPHAHARVHSAPRGLRRPDWRRACRVLRPRRPRQPMVPRSLLGTTSVPEAGRWATAICPCDRPDRPGSPGKADHRLGPARGGLLSANGMPARRSRPGQHARS